MTEQSLAQILGVNVLKYRTLAGLSQAVLAERVGVSTAFISRVECGKKMMKVHTLYETARALNVSCDALLQTEGPAANLENIRCLLEDQPSEYLGGIEKLIRVCVEEFKPKETVTSDML